MTRISSVAPGLSATAGLSCYFLILLPLTAVQQQKFKFASHVFTDLLAVLPEYQYGSRVSRHMNILTSFSAMSAPIKF